jgi:2-haloacid dehalogenase
VSHIDAVVFDVGGVLLDWSPNYLYDELIPDAVQREYFLTTIATPDWNRQQDAGRPWDEAVAELTGRHPDHAEWIAAYDTGWPKMVRGLFDDTVQVLTELRTAKVPTYALTNFSVDKWQVAQETYPVLREFDGVVVSGAERVMKPDEKIYRILLERYGLVASRTYFTDDVAENVAGALATGIQAEQFVDATRLRAALVSHGLLTA